MCAATFLSANDALQKRAFSLIERIKLNLYVKNVKANSSKRALLLYVRISFFLAFIFCQGKSKSLEKDYVNWPT